MIIPPKKAQLHLTETIAVLFIFLVLVVLGIVFYYQYSMVALKQDQERLLAAKATDITLKALFLPELQCTRGEAEPEDNCVDMLKVRAAPDVFALHLSEYYYSIFTYADITIQQVYPEEKSWSLYHKSPVKKQEDGTEVKAWTQKKPTFLVVALRDEVPGESGPRYGFGYITVEVYS